MSPTLLIVLTALSTYRTTHLLTTDTFPPIQWVRDRIAAKFGDDSAITYLSMCQWCASVYVGGVLTWLVNWHYGVPAPLLVWATASAVTGFLSAVEP